VGDRYFREGALSRILSFIDSMLPLPPRFGVPAFSFQGDDPAQPVVSHEPTAVIHNTYINPGAVLFHNGQFHMFFNSFTAWPGVIQIAYLTSPDGLSWQPAQFDPVFTTDQISYDGGRADVSSVIVLDDGLWAMYFHTLSLGEIGRATAPSPLGPWTADPEPVLRPGTDGDWDDAGLAWPSLVRDKEGWRMYYAGRTSGGLAIGLATSPDGVRWTKDDDPETAGAPYVHSDPVLVGEVDWETGRVDRPRVTASPDGWVMLYQGGPYVERRGLALSRDGIRWQTYQKNPIFTPDAFPIPGAKTWDTTLVYHDGAYYYWMELGSLSGTDLYLARHNGSLLR